jgi:glutathione S-transferase
MRLCLNPRSPNVRLTAAVLGLELEERRLDFAKGEHKNPGYLALNPNGAVPTLVDGDFVLTALTIADLTLASSLTYAKQAEIPLAEAPNVQAWFGRMSELDGWKKTAG